MGYLYGKCKRNYCCDRWWVDVNHNDLSAKILGGDNTFSIETNQFGEQFSHGSHVAGIAAAVTNNTNNNGVAGVDWQAKIHSKHVINNGLGEAGIAKAIRDAVAFSPNVWTLNHSWALNKGRDAQGFPIPGLYSVTVRSAFSTGYKNNRVQCVAMGNHQIWNNGIYANIVGYPVGFNSGIIAVGATDIFDGIADFSANGPHIDVSAPGVNIPSTNFNNGYINLSGTSMATPHVAGLASLLKGFNTNLANDDIEQIIRLSADDKGAMGFDNQFGMGRINAQRALQLLQAPNTLQQLSTTGGTIFSTTGTTTKVFLGVPGLADAAYFVKRSEVRTNITFPAMCNLIGAWGRGVGTTGYREELNRCYGEGICEVVPGTLTNTSATLRTFIYEVFTAAGQNVGFYPKAAANVVFQYTILGVPKPSIINGDNTVCGTSNPFTISSLPIGATVVWTASPLGIVTINTPNGQSTSITKITDGLISLTATISNACNGSNIIITKSNIRIGGPGDIQGVTTEYATIHCTVNGYKFTIIGAEGATNFKWYSTNITQSTPAALFRNSSLRTQRGPSDGSCDQIVIKIEAENSCTLSNPKVYTFPSDMCPPYTDGSCTYGRTLAASPNPSPNSIQITLVDETNVIPPYTQPKKIMKVRIVDKMGIIRRNIAGSGAESMILNISSLATDTYTIIAYDGKTWMSKQIIKN